MNKAGIVFFVALSTILLNGCATTDTVVVDNTAEYTDYSPGFTGYTIGFHGGGYNDGYGPSFWNPRHYYYSGE